MTIALGGMTEAQSGRDGSRQMAVVRHSGHKHGRNMRQTFDVKVDADHGGRWTSLVDPRGREWLWRRPDPRRDDVRPGDAFVDVGGVEECLPTIGANPDHGELWTRPWQEESHDGSVVHSVEWGRVRLIRRIGYGPTGIVADYRLAAPAGFRFIWAAHALLELNVGARFDAPPGPARAWPDHRTVVDTSWPTPNGVPYATIGPDDGSAMFCLLPGQAEMRVVDGEDRLRFQLQCEDQPVSMGLWRNLGGYPFGAEDKYRNVGVEPMLGRVFDLDAAGPDEAAVVPSGGVVRWRLTIDNR